MQARKPLSLIALTFAVAGILGVSAVAETDLTSESDAALFGDHAAVPTPDARPDAAVMRAWPCIDAPGCDRPPLGALSLTGAALDAPAPSMTVSPVPLPAALTLLGVALAGAGLGLRSRRGA